MPKFTIRYRRRKTNRKRRSARRRNPYSLTRPMQRMSAATVCPPSVNVMLPYTYQYEIAAGITNDSHTFAYNDVFDPYTGSGGLQPVGFDQWTQFYLRYCVTSCHIAVEFMNITPLNISELVMYPSQNGGVLGNSLYAAAQPRMVRALTVGSASEALAKVRRTYKVPFELGRVAYDTVYTGTATSSPPTRFYANVIVSSLDGVTSLAGSFVRVTMKFRVKFFSPNNLILG